MPAWPPNPLFPIPHSASMASPSSQPSSSLQTAEGQGWYVEIIEQPLDLLKLTQLVTHPAAGAISTFIGTTRNNFNDKAVLYLEYEAYVPMALAKLKVRWICARHTHWAGVGVPTITSRWCSAAQCAQ